LEFTDERGWDSQNRLAPDGVGRRGGRKGTDLEKSETSNTGKRREVRKSSTVKDNRLEGQKS
jgi:hypothetical protein